MAAPTGRALLLLPGFLSSPSSYGTLLAPVVETGARVVVPSLSPSRAALLTSRYTVDDEALDAAALVRRLQQDGYAVVLVGHSRGGQAALRAARTVDGMEALVLLDPVDGGGRRPSWRTTTAFRTRLGVPTTVVGAGIGGPCAPGPVNHEAFADCLPDARHVVVDELGHADLLDGVEQALGARLCSGAADAEPGRTLVSRLLVEAIEGRDPAELVDPRLRVVR